MPGPPERVLLKLSGRAFQETPDGKPFSSKLLDHVTSAIAELRDTQLAIVVGGGNIIRGARTFWLDRLDADSMGMLATLLNAMALRSLLEHKGREAIIQSAVNSQYAPPISHQSALKALDRGEIVIFAGGTGNPGVTTDTAAASHAVNIEADVLAKATDVNGIFEKLPPEDPNDYLPSVSFEEYFAKRYGIMDMVAVTTCREGKDGKGTFPIPIEIFHMMTEGALQRIAAGQSVGTRIDTASNLESEDG